MECAFQGEAAVPTDWLEHQRTSLLLYEAEICETRFAQLGCSKQKEMESFLLMVQHQLWWRERGVGLLSQVYPRSPESPCLEMFWLWDQGRQPITLRAAAGVDRVLAKGRKCVSEEVQGNYRVKSLHWTVTSTHHNTCSPLSKKQVEFMNKEIKS